MIPFEQSVVNWLTLGGLVAILYSLRYLVVLERRLIAVEASMQRMLYTIEQNERQILLQEDMIAKNVLRKFKKKSQK